MRLVLTRISLLFFFISSIACLVQGLLQAFLFNSDLRQYELLQQVLHTGRVPPGDLPYLTRKRNIWTLQVCKDVPFVWTNGTNPCHTVFETGNPQLANVSIPAPFRRSVRRSRVVNAAVIADHCVRVFSETRRSVTNPDNAGRDDCCDARREQFYSRSQTHLR